MMHGQQNVKKSVRVIWWYMPVKQNISKFGGDSEENRAQGYF